ncbi:sigma factor [Priestia megaterium]
MVEYQTTITNEELLMQYHTETDEVKKEAIKEEFFNANIRFVYFITYGYRTTGYPLDEISLIATEGMLKAFYTFDPFKGIKFTSYAAVCMRNKIGEELRKGKSNARLVSLESPLTTDKHGNELKVVDLLIDETQEKPFDDVFDVPEARELYRVIKHSLKEIELKIFTDIIIAEEPRTQLDVANELGFTQSYMSRYVKIVQEKAKKAVALHYFKQEREVSKRRVGVCKIKS